MPIKINETYVKNIAAPAVGSKTVMDSDLTGFGLRISAGGTRQFFLDYRHNGHGRRVAIGKFGDWTATEARAKAKQLRQLVDGGADPAVEKRERREAADIADLIERYKRDHLPTRRNVRMKEEERVLKLIEDILGKHTKVQAVHHGDMENLHKQITESRGPVRANRVMGVASKMFSMSLRPLAGEDKAWRSPLDGNPCSHVARNHEEASGKLYSPAQMAAIADGLAIYGGRGAADCITLIMMTGCRPCEARQALWEEFDREPGFWVKPSAHTKQKKEHRVPLSPPALQLVEQLRAKRAPGQKAVFPGRGPDGTVTQINHCWMFVRKHAGLDVTCRIYDLRHTYASSGASGGLSLPIIGRLLGHTVARTTERYAKHLADDPLKDAVNLIAGKITGKPRLVSGG